MCFTSGYVHLERMGITPFKKNSSTEDEVDLSSIAEDGSEFFSDGESHYDPPQSRPLSSERRAGSNSTLGSSLLYDQSQIRPQFPLHQTTTSNLASSKLSLSRSMPDLLDGESPTASIYGSRFPAQRNKIPSIDDTNYNSMSESRSIQSQSTVSKRDQGRSVTRNTRSNYRMQTRSTSGSTISSISSGYKSGNSDCDSDYVYSTVKSYPKSKPLDASEMPESCFCQVTYTQDDRIYDPKEERKRIVSTKERKIRDERTRLNYDVWYLNSSRFRRRFYHVFVESLALPLDLKEAIRYRSSQNFGSVIFCDKVEVSTISKCNISESYEVIPCVWTQWPECASEWLDRPRNSWPSYESINQIRKSGCYIIPQEYVSKEQNSNYKIEWQLAFPAAERYLETCMSHAQMQVYIIVLMLHKTFIRAVESASDRLNTHQIRNQLFWLMEKTPTEWPENRTGELCY